MPTNRLNISLTNENTIEELKDLRKELQRITDRESISYSEIIRALLEVKPNSTKYLAEFI